MHVARYLCFTLAFSAAVAVIGVASRPLDIRQDFYAVVAQVLPVFLLVIAVEGRFFRDRPQHSAARRLLAEQLLVLMLLAECFALATVAHGSASVPLRGGVLAGLVLALLTFAVLASDGPWPDRRRRDR